LNSKLLRKCVSNFYVAFESPIFFKSGFKKQRKFKNAIFKRFIKLIKQKRFTLIRPIFKNKKFHSKQRYFVKKQLRHNLNFIPGKFDKRHTGMKSKSNDSFHYFKYGKSYAKKQFYLNEWKYSKKKKQSRLWVLFKKRRFLFKKIKKIYTKLTRPFNRRKKYSVRLAKKMP